MKQVVRKIAVFGVAAASMALAAAPMFADGLEFHGYARSGLEIAADGTKDGGQVDEHWLGRLGNEENQTYAESELDYKTTNDEGVWSKYGIMFMYNNSSPSASYNALSYSSSSGMNWDFAVRQTYLEMGGFSWDPKSTYWIGERYTGRDDIHTLDFFWRDYSGAGFGVTQAINGMVDFSATCTNGFQSWNGKTVLPVDFDLRVRPFTNMGALNGIELEGNLAYQKGASSGSANGTDYGTQGAVVYNFDKFFGFVDGSSRAAVQFAFGNAATDWNIGHAYTGTVTQSSAYAVRGLLFGEATNILPNFDVMPAAIYEMVNSGISGEDTASKCTFIARGDYKFTSNLSLQAEGSFAHEFGTNSNTWWGGSNATGMNGNEYKFTLAPTLSLNSGFWGRPQLRAFWTIVGGDKNAIGGYVDSVNSALYQNRVGVQFETWF